MFDRGFKSWCERYAASIREKLQLAPTNPLGPRVLAEHLGVRVWTPHDVKGLSGKSLQILLHSGSETRSCWSAVTVVVGANTAVILNSSHSPGRQSSSLMHELSHRTLEHGAKKVDASTEGIMLLSSYDKKQEDEADWLAGCLLLPRDALVRIRKENVELPDAARLYGVSLRMLNYRMAMTGVNRQFSAPKSRKSV